MDLIEVKEGKYFRHPWEIARAAGILCTIPKVKFANTADIGAGDLYFLKLFLKQFSGKAFAVDRSYEDEHDIEGIKLLRNIGQVRDNSLDIAFLMDVLEHEESDRYLLKETLTKIKSGGIIVVTVPAHQFLFSEHDIYLNHCRRYSLSGLLELTKGLEVEITKCFSFFTLLFFIRLIQVFFAKSLLFKTSGSGVGGWTFPESHLLTKFLSSILKIDFTVNREMSGYGLYTLGLSICMILKKKSV